MPDDRAVRRKVSPRKIRLFPYARTCGRAARLVAVVFDAAPVRSNFWLIWTPKITRKCHSCTEWSRRLFDKDPKMTELRVVPDPAEPKRRGHAPKGPRPPADAGKLERSTWLEINELGLSGREYDRWREVAIMAAKTADSSMAEGKPAHFNPAIKVLTEAMDRLHAMKRKSGESGGDILGGLGSFGATGS